MKIVECKPHKLEAQVNNAMNEFMPKYYKNLWTKEMSKMIIDGINGFNFYSLPKCLDLNKMIFLAKFSIWAFLLDDIMESNEDECEKWAEIFRSQKSTNDTPLELMWKDIWDEATRVWTIGQQNRLLTCYETCMTTYKKVRAMKTGETEVSTEEHIQLRLIDTLHRLAWLEVEYSTGMPLDDVIDEEVVQDYHNCVARYGIILNDLFSYEKDLKDGSERFNYIHILSRENSISLDNSAIRARNEMDKLFIQRLDAIQRIKDAGFNISDEYFQRIDDMLNGLLYYTSVSKRYNEFGRHEEIRYV